MSVERFEKLLRTTPGTGVKVTTANGEKLQYFYKDHGEPASGIQRAMAELYPLFSSGIITELIFVEGAA